MHTRNTNAHVMAWTVLLCAGFTRTSDTISYSSTLFHL